MDKWDELGGAHWTCKHSQAHQTPQPFRFFLLSQGGRPTRYLRTVHSLNIQFKTHKTKLGNPQYPSWFQPLRRRLTPATLKTWNPSYIFTRPLRRGAPLSQGFNANQKLAQSLCRWKQFASIRKPNPNLLLSWDLANHKWISLVTSVIWMGRGMDVG